MKAIQFTVTVLRYAFGLVFGALAPAAYVGPFSCAQYREVPVPQLPGPDWVWISLWLKELNVQGSFAYSSNERYRGRVVRPFPLTIAWMAEGVLDLSPLLTHTFRLEDYRRALHVAMHKSRHELIKAAFVFDR